MQIKISARHGHLSDKSQATIESKVEKLTRIFDRLTEILVTVDLENRESPKVDLLVSAEHKKDFKASGEGELMSTLDGVISKMEAQLRKYKQKIQEHHPH